MANLVLWTLVVCYALVCEAQFNPYVPGESDIYFKDYRRLTTVGLPEDLDVWAPTGNGSYPVLWFLSGFGAVMPSPTYNDVMERIASHGFVVIGLWRIVGNEDNSLKVDRVQQSIDWSKKHLEDDLKTNGSVSEDFSIDYDQSFGFSHSNGGNLLFNYLMVGCGDFKGIVMSSPVDGPPDWTAINGTVNFDIPTLIIPVGLDSAKAPAQPVACAPESISNRVFYDALVPESPRWMVNATEWGHADILDQELSGSPPHICATRLNSTVEEYDTYRSFVAGQTVSFMLGFLEVDCNQYLVNLEDTSLMPVAAVAEHEDTQEQCQPGYCKWYPIDDYDQI